MKRLLTDQTINDGLKYFTWDWSASVKVSLIEAATQLLGFKQTDDNKEKLTIAKRFKVFTVYPYEAVDAKSTSIIMSVYERLFDFNEDGTLYNKLVRHYELYDEYLDLYLRPNVYFHDGSRLTSQDVINCLEHSRSHYNTEDMMKPIQSIEKLDQLSLRINFNHFPNIIQTLGHPLLSIFKQENSTIFGNGPFYIDFSTEYTTILKRFEHYYGYSAYLDIIEMIYIPDNRYMMIGHPYGDKKSVSRNLGFHYLCKTHNSKLSLEQVKYIQYILMKEYRFELNEEFTVSLEKPVILTYSNYPSLAVMKIPIFKDKVVIDCIGIDDIRYIVLERLLNKYHIPVEIRFIDFNKNPHQIKSYKSDFLCFGEYLYSPENSGYYNFIFNQLSSIHPILKNYEWYEKAKKIYQITPYERWLTLNVLLDRKLFKEGILFPIYNNEIILNYDEDLEGVSINAMGFLNFNEIWKK